MCKIDPLIRLTANNSGETKCIIFVDSIKSARTRLDRYVNTIVGCYPFIRGFGALVNVHSLNDLAGLDCVSAVVSHTNVTASMNRVRGHFDIEDNWKKGLTGKGVCVAVIDSGIRPHLDFVMPRYRIKAFKDFISGYDLPYDDNGHGTSVSGILGGNGLISNGKFSGIAPKCDLIMLKAIGADGEGGAFAILEAMQWIFTNKDRYNIKVVCMSFGAPPLADNDPLMMGAEALWQSGLVVVASAGNNGPEYSTIRSPGASPLIITVGGIGYTEDDQIYVPDFSSRGPVGDFIKPDIVADAVNIKCCSLHNFYNSLSGTSAAAPIIAGLCALILQKNPSYSPDKVKELLLNNSKSLGGDKNITGYGTLDKDFLKSYEV